MYELRIPNLTVAESLSNQISRNREEYSRKMIQISDGKKYLNRSENPLDTEEAQALRITQDKIEQWKNNLGTAESWEKITDSTSQEILEIMHRVNETVAQANNGLNAVNGRESIVREIDSILESLVQFGNTSYDGTSIFAGTATCVDKNGSVCDDPFTVDRDASGQITTVYFLGNSDPAVNPTTSQKKIATGDNTQIEYGTIGEGETSMFKFTHYENTGTEAAPNWQNVEVRVFDELIKFRDALADPNATLDEKNMARLQAGLDNVIERTVDTSATQSRIKRATSNLESMDEATVNRISLIEDVDEATAITELYQIQASLQASMQMINKMNDMSIINFIR